MGFLVITCIGPTKSFLGFFPISWAMIIMAGIMVAIAAYTYGEAKVFFNDVAVYGLINKTALLVIELVIAFMLFNSFLLKKKFYTLVIYLVMVGMAGLGLTVNIHKLSVMDLGNIGTSGERKFLEWLYFIRIGGEFFLEGIICYMCYSYKKSL